MTEGTAPGTRAPAWWSALGGRNALSVWSWLLPTAAALAFTALVEVPAFGYRPWPRVLLVVCVQVVLIPLMVGGHALLRRQAHPKPVLGMSIFVALGMTRGFAVDVLAPYIEPVAMSSLAYQLALNVTYALLTLPFIALAVDSIRRYRELRARVRDEARRWQQALSEAEAEFAREYATYRETVDSEVMARVIDLQDEIASLAREAAGAGALAGAEELRRLSAEVVRPLSHELILEPSAIRVVPAPLAAPPPHLGLRDVLRDAGRSPLAGHWGVCLVMGLLGLVGLSPYGSAPLLVVNLGWDLLIFGAVPAALRPWITVGWSRMPASWAWLLSACLWAVLGLVGVAGTASIMSVVIGDGVVFWAVTVAYLVLSALSAVAVAGFRRQLALQAELTGLLSRQEALASRLIQRIDYERRELGLVLHGSVQASLTRAAIVLDRWGETLDPQTLPAVISEVGAALDGVVSALDLRDHLQVGLEAVVRDRLRLWDGAIDCRASISEEAAAATDGAVAKVVGEVVGEAVTNAVRHGQAETVEVDVALEGDWICVRVWDDGLGPVGTRHLGAGLGTLGDSGVSWSLERVGGRTLLTVRLGVLAAFVMETEQSEGPATVIA